MDQTRTGKLKVVFQHNRVSRTLLLGLSIAMASSGCFLDPDSNGPSFAFDAQTIDLALTRDTAFALSNNGSDAFGPISLVVTSLETTAGEASTGLELVVTPAEIGTLNAGESRTIVVSVAAPDGTPDNAYRAVLVATVAELGTVATVELHFTIVACANADVAAVTITDGPTTLRQGDVGNFSVATADAAGNPVSGPPPCWEVVPSSAGFVDNSGNFVGYEPGNATVVVQVGQGADSVDVNVTARNVSGTLNVVGAGRVDTRFTSDLWVHGNVVYTGTWGTRSSSAGQQNGNTLFVWDITDATAPILTDSVRIDARVVNDVKVRSSGDLAVITHEGSGDGQNGITLLDLTDPLRPTIITRFSSSLTTGVHNAWVEGNFVYLVVDGVSPTSGLRILDISNPNQPQIASEFYGGSSFLHDVYVRDGLAFLSHWNAGLIILDIGNGIVGGTPDNPVEVSRILTQGGQTHNAWYWPAGGYVFVGEEDFGSPGITHVVDVKDLQRPKEVATFRVPGTTPHNFWMDDAAGVLYLSWYENGIRVLDVSGDLLGALDQQNREMASSVYNGPALTRNWAPQLHNGLLFLSDLESGLWILRFTP